MRIAQMLVGTPIGAPAKSFRAKLEQWLAHDEVAGTVANDRLAEFLLIRFAEHHFVDVGSHIGSIIAGVEKHCPDVLITGIEPIPAKAENLRRKFPRAVIHECALSDNEGAVDFFINPAASGYSSLSSDAGNLKIVVPVKRLDGLVSSPDVVKIDVEGAELGVLRGMENLRTRPLIMFESGPNEVLGYTKSDLWQWLSDRDYSIFVPNRLAHTAPPMSLDLFFDSHQYPRRTTNYFAVPVEEIGRVRERARRLLRAP